MGLIAEVLISYPHLTSLHPPQLSEMIGVGEDTAEEMIACAEEWAEEAEEQARQAEAEAQRARELEKQKVFFGGAAPEAAPAEAKTAVRRLFGAGESS